MNTLNKIIYTIVLVTLMGCQKQDINSEQILSHFFRDNISYKKDSLVCTIEYCPDNTCETFSISSEKSFLKLADFVYIYLFYVSDYYYLSDFREKGEKYVFEIVKRNSQGCSGDNELKLAKCVLESLYTKYSIEMKFVRFDEFERNEVAIDLKEMLNNLSVQ